MGKNGLIYRDSKVKLAAVPDGTSNTLMVGETRYAETTGGHPSYQCPWTAGYYLGGAGTYMATGAATYNSPNSKICDPANRASTPGAAGCHTVSSQTFGGYHQGGVLFVRGDGSVGFISNDIELGLYQSLGSRNDGSGVMP